MGLRINTNIASQEVQRNLRTSNALQEAEFSKLSSGKRINKSADDAAGLAIANKLEAETRGLRMATRNANDAISMVQSAEGGLNETSNILTRLRELSIQAASDTMSDQDRGYLAVEYDQLVQEADRISKTTSFNGRQLLSGKGEVLQFQVGAYSGEDNIIEIDSSLSDSSAESLGISGSSVRDKSDAVDNLERIDNAISKVSAFRANFGSLQSRLNSTINNLDVAVINQESARSRIQDTDVAESSAKLASAQIKTAAGAATLVQANGIGNAALRLIG
jgi:flagellin